MEGPDTYSQAGGLGVRVAHMSRALAAAGYPTSLFFVGDPALPHHEVRQGVDLFRLAQEVSRAFPRGIYDGEEVKREYLATHFPQELVHGWAARALESDLTPILLFEEWHTAGWTKSVSDLLWRNGVRDRCLLVWNANNQFGFDSIDWPALAYTAAVTTVSRYMRVLLQNRGIDPIVIPNGIPETALERPDSGQVALLRRAAGGTPMVVKIGRFHPDKRWQQAIRAMALLRRSGVAVRMLARGGGEPYGRELMAEATSLGLSVVRWSGEVGSTVELARAISSAPTADILELGSFLPEALLPYLYASSTAVLANSGFEPFGLVGLETMAAGGVTLVGATGEDYARHLHNCFVVQTDDPRELADGIFQLLGDARLRSSIRRNGRSTARTYTWPQVVASDMVPRLPILARRQMARWPGIESGT